MRETTTQSSIDYLSAVAGCVTGRRRCSDDGGAGLWLLQTKPIWRAVHLPPTCSVDR
jgi:hypothetical protein